jgi:elongation factor Ts
MAKVTLDMIKKLRSKTTYGIIECKKALCESEGDIDKAKHILDNKGILNYCIYHPPIRGDVNE